MYYRIFDWGCRGSSFCLLPVVVSVRRGLASVYKPVYFRFPTKMTWVAGVASVYKPVYFRFPTKMTLSIIINADSWVQK